MDFLNYKLPSLKGKTVLITGASSGIGEACAYLLASKGMNLNLVARREDKLIGVEKVLKNLFPNIQIHLVVGDINDSSTFDEMEQGQFFKSDICLNNAGLAIGLESVLEGSEEDWDLMIQTNIKSAFKVIKYALPYMKENGGDIISVSSIAGHTPYENGSVYCASKAALKSFMTSLRRETFGEDIRVMMLSPGMVKTGFSKVRFRGDQLASDRVYQDIGHLTAIDMAHHLYYMISRPRHVNIEDIITMPTDQGAATLVKRHS